MTPGNRIFFFIIMFLPAAVRAQQPYLQLDRKGFGRDVNYYAGDNIVFRMKDENFNRHDKIEGFTDSSIVFETYRVLIRDLKYVRYEVTGGLLSPSNGPKLILAGLVLMGADYLNYTLIHGNTYKPDKELFIVSGIMVVAGSVLMSLRFHKFRPSANRKITVKIY